MLFLGVKSTALLGVAILVLTALPGVRFGWTSPVTRLAQGAQHTERASWAGAVLIPCLPGLEES